MASTVPIARVRKLRTGVNLDDVVLNGFTDAMTAQELTDITGLGMTCIRVPVDLSKMIAGTVSDFGSNPSTAAEVTAALAALDATLVTATAGGLTVILSPFVNSKIKTLTYAAAEAIITAGASFLVSRYSALYTGDQVLFDVMNEPYFDSPSWNLYLPTLVAAMRAIAPLHTFIVSGVQFAKPELMSNLTVLADTNVIYAFHEYTPARLTQQGYVAAIDPLYLFPKPPGSTNTTEMTYDKLYANLKLAIDFGRTNGVVVLMEEFGCTNLGDAQSRYNWMRFVRYVAESNNIGWLWWSWRGRKFGINRKGGSGIDTNMTAILTAYTDTVNIIPRFPIDLDVVLAVDNQGGVLAVDGNTALQVSPTDTRRYIRVAIVGSRARVVIADTNGVGVKTSGY